jgi:hypothetical protein
LTHLLPGNSRLRSGVAYLAFACAAAFAASAQAADWGLFVDELLEPPSVKGASGAAPEKIGSQVLFRFEAPPDAVRVSLATEHNNWAHNRAGRVELDRYAMQRGSGPVWYQWIDVTTGEPFTYRYVVDFPDGSFEWLADPHVSARDGEGNSVFQAPLSAGKKSGELVLARQKAPAHSEGTYALRLRPSRVVFSRGEPIRLELGGEGASSGETISGRLEVMLCDPFGKLIERREIALKNAEMPYAFELSPVGKPGGYLMKSRITGGGPPLRSRPIVVSVSDTVGPDLRYGFFASYENADGDFEAQARMLADFHVNAAEYYDYFPNHGDYAPDALSYRFEPFGVQIEAASVRGKLEAARGRGIRSLAYIAAYAASESVYRDFPYPMTTASGEPLVFNGRIQPESEAEAQGRGKWFWLMDISPDSKWTRYILEELRSALIGDAAAGLRFDGFEIDTYGNRPDERFYAEGSERSGDLLSDVLVDFVQAVKELTHRHAPDPLVSFNSVNEFGASRMSDVTDFHFLEIWREHTDRLSDLIDIPHFYRRASQKRAVLKLYPVDMEQVHESFPPLVLARLLGATMTGGGSLMVAGEPNPETGAMHGLRSLYYPDHKPLSDEAASILKAYNRHDALMYGITHGAGIENAQVPVSVSETFAHTYVDRNRQRIIVQLLHHGGAVQWSETVESVPVVEGRSIKIQLPEGAAPKSLWYASPDFAEYTEPQRLRFEMSDGVLATKLPQSCIHGTLILEFAE